jgi:phosphopantetheinyl transferase (holo-ACP synthase)
MARILGFGTDLLRTGRIGELVRRRGLAQLARRILTADEQRALDQVVGQPAQERFLAVRYVRQGCARLSLNFLSLV